MKGRLRLASVCLLILGPAAAGTLDILGKIPLPGSKGRIDHLAFDAARVNEVLVSARERRSLPPDLQQPVNAARARHQHALSNVVAAGVQSHQFKVDDVEIATNAVLDMLQGVKEWGRHLFVDLDRLIDQYQGLVLAALGADSGGDTRDNRQA